MMRENPIHDNFLFWYCTRHFNYFHPPSTSYHQVKIQLGHYYELKNRLSSSLYKRVAGNVVLDFVYYILNQFGASNHYFTLCNNLREHSISSCMNIESDRSLFSRKHINAYTNVKLCYKLICATYHILTLLVSYNNRLCASQVFTKSIYLTTRLYQLTRVDVL